MEFCGKSSLHTHSAVTAVRSRRRERFYQIEIIAAGVVTLDFLTAVWGQILKSDGVDVLTEIDVMLFAFRS